ncbi:MAG: type IV pilin protein [Planctomycetota bacterium]|jgi:prepilin-type N-terminal cleavage/methylation domain-containing protein
MPSAGKARSALPKASTAQRGFTLIELMAVVVILSILAGVALPKFIDYRDQAKEAACKGALSGVRAGMASFLVDTTIGGTPAYPDFAELGVPGMAMQEELPENPYNGKNGINFLGLGDSIARSVIANNRGWNYYVKNAPQPVEAVFWPNSNTIGENTW